eukprot:7764777-Pyramimonas_sp.AAC.1
MGLKGCAALPQDTSPRWPAWRCGSLARSGQHAVDARPPWPTGASALLPPPAGCELRPRLALARRSALRRPLQ